MAFFDFWSRMKEQGALLRRANQLKLDPSQLSQLLGDSEVRAGLQNEGMASLLPPVGTEVFRRFTAASFEDTQQRHEAEEKKQHSRKNTEDQAKPAAHLEAGKPLPFIYGAPPSELLSIPLVELDPFFQPKKTFLVLSKENTIHRFNAESALYLLSPANPLRTLSIRVLVHPWFRVFITLTILMTMFFRGIVQSVGIAVFAFEALVKILSRGVCVGRFTFLRDPCSWLDIFIIIMGCLAGFVHLGEFSGLIKVALLLKICTVSPALKMAVKAMIQSAKRLTHVTALAVFGLSVLAVIGLQLFMGALKNKCVIMPSANFTADYEDDHAGSSAFNFSKYIRDEANYYHLPGHRDALLCGNSSDAGVCPEGFVCLKTGRNPNYGYTNYDTFGWSLLASFRLMMQDFSEDLLQLTLRASGKSYVSFFVLVIFPGCFFLLSLIVAAVAMALAEQKEAVIFEAKQKEEEFRRIMEVLKVKAEEPEDASSRAEVSVEQDSTPTKGAAEQEGGEEDHTPSCCTFITVCLKGDCCGCWRGLKRRLQTVVLNPFFDLGIVMCIIINTIFMSMEHYPLTAEFEELLITADLVFTGIFAVEMLLKLVALGPYGYFQVSWHIYDFIMVILSLLGLVLVFVDFNLFRILRLARWWPTLHMFMKTVWSALGSPALVLFLVVFMFSSIGMMLFGGNYAENVCRVADDCTLPRWHMHDFFHSFLVICSILCGEWVEILWDCMELSGRGSCLAFFVVVIVIGNLLVLYLFLSLLLNSLSDDKLTTPEDEGTNKLQSAMKLSRSLILTMLGKKHHDDAEPRENGKEGLALAVVISDQAARGGNCDDQTPAGRKMASYNAPIAEAEADLKLPEDEEVKLQCDVPKPEEDGGQRENTPEDCCWTGCYRCCSLLDVDTSRGAGRVWSNFRRACLLIVQHKCFEAFIILIIVLSSAALMFEDIHLQQRPVLKMVLDKADQVFTFLFLVEMLLKWVAFGLKKYFTSFWCWLDFLILDVSLLSPLLDMMGYSSQPLRALRTMRALSRFQGFKVVLRALMVTLPSMFDVLLVALFIWLFFSICGVYLFAGKFYYCFNETSAEIFPSEQVNNKSQCFSLILENSTDVRWVNTKFNFDNVPSGYLSLLLMATSSGWKDIMYAAVDSGWVEGQPVFESNLYMYLYFVLFVIIGCFFTFNLFIRVFVDGLLQQRQKFGGKRIFMTEEQQKYSRRMNKFFFSLPAAPRPQNRCQARLFDLVTGRAFEIFMVVVICLNVLLLMMETDDQAEEGSTIMHWFHFTFILIFLIEFFLKIFALGRRYFRSVMNVVDLVVLLLSITGLFLADLMEKYFFSPSLTQLLRLGRVGRILPLIPHARGIQTLILGFVMSLPALFNIGLLLFLIVYTFACTAMFNFPHVKKEQMIDDMLNFETFGNSMISLITITTSSGWDGLLGPIMNTPPDCDPDVDGPERSLPGNCGSPAVGVVFFTSYVCLFFLLVIQLFIAVILESFNTRDLEDAEPVSDAHLQMFLNTWKKFDPSALQVIKYSQLADFCDALQDPLRIPKTHTDKLNHADLPLLPGDQIRCLDVLQAVATQAFGEFGTTESLKARLEERFPASRGVGPTGRLHPAEQTAPDQDGVQDLSSSSH